MPEQLLASNRDLKLDNIDVVADTSNFKIISNFSPFVNLRWINRSTSFGVPLKFNNHRKIGILVSADTCEQWKCLKNVDSKSVINATNDFKILLLKTNSSAIFKTDGYLEENYVEIINKISADIQGPTFDSNVRVIS